MSGVVVTCCSSAINRPASNPASRPTDITRVSIPASVAGEAQAMTGVVRRVVNDLRISKAGQEDQAEPDEQGDHRRSQRFVSFRRPDDGRYRTCHLNLLGRPSDSPNAPNDGRSPGSRVFAFGHLPGCPVVFRPRLADYSCGGSRGFGPKDLTAFPCSVARLIGATAKARQRDSAGLLMTPQPPIVGAMAIESDEQARHKAKMANRKAVQDAEVAQKTVEKGLLIVHTGKGKGKSTAAWGLLLRALGRGWRCGVVQFGKGAWQTGERAALQRFADQVDWHTLGEGFT